MNASKSKKFIKDTQEKKPNCYFNFRLPESLRDEFEVMCDEVNIERSALLRYMIARVCSDKDFSRHVVKEYMNIQKELHKEKAQ